MPFKILASNPCEKVESVTELWKKKPGSGSSLLIFIYGCWTLQQGEEMKLFQMLHQLCSKGQVESPATTAGCAAIPSGNSVPSLHLYSQAPDHYAVKCSRQQNMKMYQDAAFSGV